MTTGKVKDEELWKYLAAVRQAKWLLDTDVAAYLQDELYGTRWKRPGRKLRRVLQVAELLVRAPVFEGEAQNRPEPTLCFSVPGCHIAAVSTVIHKRGSARPATVEKLLNTIGTGLSQLGDDGDRAETVLALLSAPAWSGWPRRRPPMTCRRRATEAPIGSLRCSER